MKKVFLEISQNSQENTCSQSLFLNKVAGLRPATLFKKRLWPQVFSCEFCEISKNAFPYRTPLVAASVDSSHFSSLIFHDCSLKFSKQKVSYSEPFQSRPRGI